MIFLIAFIALLYGASCLGPENERNAKLDKEDRILHDLTACREDVKPASYTGYHNVTGRF